MTLIRSAGPSPENAKELSPILPTLNQPEEPNIATSLLDEPAAESQPTFSQQEEVTSSKHEESSNTPPSICPASGPTTAGSPAMPLQDEQPTINNASPSVSSGSHPAIGSQPITPNPTFLDDSVPSMVSLSVTATETTLISSHSEELSTPTCSNMSHLSATDTGSNFVSPLRTSLASKTFTTSSLGSSLMSMEPPAPSPSLSQAATESRTSPIPMSLSASTIGIPSFSVAESLGVLSEGSGPLVVAPAEQDQPLNKKPPCVESALASEQETPEEHSHKAQMGPHGQRFPNPRGLDVRSVNSAGRTPAQIQHKSYQAMNTPPTVILVMGVSGVGKTTFIHLATGNSNMTANHTLRSDKQPTNIYCYPAILQGGQYLFFDTTGFAIEDTESEQISLCEKLSQISHVNGILYLHRISDERMQGSSRRYLDLFKAICGKDCMKNVMILTTHWDRVSKEVGESRETELCEDFWREMLDDGAAVHRLDTTKPGSIHNIVESLSRHEPGILAIRQEMVDWNKPFQSTTAGRIIYQKYARTRKRKEEELYVAQERRIEYLERELALRDVRYYEVKQELEDLKKKSFSGRIPEFIRSAFR